MNHKNMRVAVIGAGPLGIQTAYELKQQGFENFRVYEAASAPGGTWHNHSYPGLACDVWAHSYTFSWARNPDWSASFVERAEIEAYLQGAAAEAGLLSYMRFQHRVDRAEYRGDGRWQLSFGNGEQTEAEAVINCMGNQFTPLFPSVPGMDSFQGPSWHSTHWNHDVDLRGKRVVIVGSAAAAVQVVPEVAKLAEQLTVLQRSPNWIMPRGRKPYSAFTRRCLRAMPWLNEALIAMQGFLMNLVLDATTLGHKRMEQFESVARKYIDKTITDPELRDWVTPKDRYGCKRPLVSDDFYPALMRDNVRLVPQGLQQVLPNGVETSDGEQIEADVIVYCTGYKVQDFDRIEVLGLEGKNLGETLAAEPEAYKGIAVPDFPNFFMGIGPNGVALTVSYFKSAALNAAAIVGLLKAKQAAGVQAISVRKDLHRQYNDWMLAQFPKYSWGSGACNSYYTRDSGHVPFLYPDRFKRFEQERRECSLEEYEVLP